MRCEKHKNDEAFRSRKIEFGVCEDGEELLLGNRLSWLIFNAVLLCSKYMLMFKMKAKKVCMVVEKKR
jgi:hypothetical protein